METAAQNRANHAAPKNLARKTRAAKIHAPVREVENVGTSAVTLIGFTDAIIAFRILLGAARKAENVGAEAVVKDAGAAVGSGRIGRGAVTIAERGAAALQRLTVVL